MSKDITKQSNKKSLQNFTNEKIEVNNDLCIQTKAANENKKREVRKRLEGLYETMWEKITNAKGLEFDRLLKIFESSLSPDDKNALWERNSQCVQQELHNYIITYKRTPSICELASLTNLSRVTVNKHIRSLKDSNIYKEEIEKHKILMGKIMSQLYVLSMKGNVKAARLYAEIISKEDEKDKLVTYIKKQQNNFIMNNQINEIAKPELVSIKNSNNYVNLFSIGYGNRKADAFLDILKEYKISCLVDIRSNPQSRFNPTYNRLRLKTFLEENGIEYLFMGETLGGKPKDDSLYINGEISYPLVWENQNFQHGIKGLLAKVEDGQRVCIMCCELHSEQCHRKNMVGEYLESTVGIATKHINSIGKIENQLFN